MKKAKQVYLKAIRNNGDSNALDISIGYDLGGYSYFSGQQSGRGFYVYVTPVRLSDNSGFRMFSCTLFEGLKRMLKPVARYSEKVASSLSLDTTEVQETIQAVLREYGMSLVLDDAGKPIEL